MMRNDKLRFFGTLLMAFALAIMLLAFAVPCVATLAAATLSVFAAAIGFELGRYADERDEFFS